jgi:hypothetical protein
MKAAGSHHRHFLVPVNPAQSPDDGDERAEGQNGAEYVRQFQQDQGSEESGRQAAAGDVTQQFPQRNAQHDNQQHHGGREEGPEPFPKKILLQNNQFCLSQWIVRQGAQFISVFL